MTPTPDPTTLDLDHIARHVQDAFNITDWTHVTSVWLTGSFAHPEKAIDRPGEDRSDLDIILVEDDYGCLEDQEPIYDGLNPADIPVRTRDGTNYGYRTMDLFSGYIEEPDPDDGYTIKLPIPILNTGSN